MKKKKKIRFSSNKVNKAIHNLYYFLNKLNKNFIFDLFNPKEARIVSLNKKLKYNRSEVKIYNSKESIPKIIHKTGKENFEKLPDIIKNIFQETINDNPDFSVKYYSDKDSLNFIKKHFDDKIVNAYKKLKPGAYKADLFRYCVLYIEGGIYGDLTQRFLCPISDIVDVKHDKLVIVRDRVVQPYKTNGIQICFLASIKNQPIFKEAIDTIVKNIESEYYGHTALDPTGPYLFRQVFQNHKTSYRLDLESDTRGKSYLRFIRTGKIAIDNKHTNHRELIGSTESNHYSFMWEKKNIYNT